MALVSKSIPNLINGVSQQPPALRLPTQGSAQENGLSDVVDGLKKRPPTKFLNKLVKVSNSWTAGSALTSSNTEAFTSIADCYITTYKRSQTEQYTVVIEPSGTPVIYVYDINGNLNYQSGKASWKGDGTWCQDNTDSTSYLANITKEEMTSTSVADATFVVNKSKVVAKSTTKEPSEVGHKALVYLKSVNYERDYHVKLVNKVPNSSGVYQTYQGSDITVGSNNANNSAQAQLKVGNVIVNLRNSLAASSANSVSGQNSQLFYNGDITDPQPILNASLETFSNEHIQLNSLLQSPITAAGFGSGVAADVLVIIGGNIIPYAGDTAQNAIDNAPSSDLYKDHSNYSGWVFNKHASNDSGGNSQYPHSVILLPLNTIALFAGNHSLRNRGAAYVITGTNVSTLGLNITPVQTTTDPFLPYFVVSAASQNFDILATDDDGGQNLRVFKDTAKSFTDLPNQCEDGFRIQVAGDNNKKEDNFYVVFSGSGGSGVWKESVAANLENNFDLSTMPHTLKQKVNSNNDLYFEFTQGQDNDGQSWRSRVAGDEDTNTDPSFVDNTINDIFFHRNRLGIISGENVVFSESSNFFNFYRTTVRGLLDSDPIDVAVSQNEVSELKAALPIQDSLLLFSELNQFTLSATQLLTPAEVTIDQSTKFECDLRTSPVGAGNSVFFNTVGGNFSGVREYYTDGETEIKDATLITSHVPEYLSGNVRKMAASTNEDMLICLTSSVKSEAYIYKWYNSNNERLQSSWSKWKFDKNVADVTFNNSDLYITFEDGSFEKMSLRTDSPDVTFTNEDSFNLATNIGFSSNGSFSDFIVIGGELGTLNINSTAQTITLITPKDVKSLSINNTTKLGTNATQTNAGGNLISYVWSETNATFYTNLSNATPAFSVVVVGTITFGGKKHEVLLDHRRKIVATTTTDGGGTVTADITNTTQLLALAPDANSTTQWIDHKGEILATGTSVQAVVNYLYDAGTSSIKTHTENGVATANHVTVGQPYAFKYQMSEQVFQPAQGDTTDLARFQLRSMNFNFNDTGTFVVTTTSTGRAAKTATYTGRITGQAQNLLSYSAVVDSDSFKVGVQSQAKETDITITSDSHLPCVFQSAEYEGWVTLRNQRL